MVLLATSANCSARLLLATHRLTLTIGDMSHRALGHRQEKHKLKTPFVTVAAAAAVSVPLAGLAWAESPADSGSNDNPVGVPGVSRRAGVPLPNYLSAFLTFSTCLRSPSVAVSIAPFITRLRTNPGSGTDGSIVMSNLTLVLSPSGLSV
jgi:hypothetical protein